MRRIIGALAAAGTAALGLAAPAAQASVTSAATCTVCSIVIYPGGGVTTPVGPPSLPAVYAGPETITAGADTLRFDVAGLQGPWGACGSACSEWVYTASPTRVQVSSFTVNGQTEHALQSVGVFSPATYWVQDPNGLGAGVWTPICLEWEGGSIKLNLSDDDWSVAAC
jgi:hypothetical protein